MNKNSQFNDSPEGKPIVMSRTETIIASAVEATEVQIRGLDTKKSNAVAGNTKDLVGDIEKESKRLEALYSQQQPIADTSKVKARGSFEDEFLMRTAERGIEAPLKLIEARAPNTLYQGTIVRIVLDRAINSDLPGAIRGRVMSDVFDSVNQRELLIPRGSVVMGSYLSSILVGQSRILVAMERLILPNGTSISLVGTPAADMQGASGIWAKVDNRFWDIFKTSLIVGAASLLLPKDQQNISVSDSAQGSRTGGTIFGTSLYDTIKQVSERNKVIKPTGTVDLGEPFSLMLSRDVEMRPYRKEVVR